MILVEIKGLNLAVKNGCFSSELLKMHVIFFSPIIISLNLKKKSFKDAFQVDIISYFKQSSGI